MTVLVLGATGRVGQLVRASWQAEPPDGLTALWQSRRGRSGFLRWDPLNKAQTLPKTRFQVILSLLGTTPETSDSDLAQNTDLARAALRLAQARGAGHVLLASSAAVYGAPKAGAAFNETQPPHPVSAYGRAKAAMETAARREAAKAGLRLTLLRIGNVAGADALLSNRAPDIALDRFADGKGPLRSYIGAGTLAAVLAGLAARAGHSGAGSGQALPDILNIAAPRPVAMQALLAAAGRRWHWCVAGPRALARVVLDTTRLEALHRFDEAESDPGEMLSQWQMARQKDPA